MSERLQAPHPLKHRAAVIAAKTALRFAGGVTVSGEENLLEAASSGEAFMLAPVHRSFLDPEILSAAVDKVLPKEQIHYMASAHLWTGSTRDFPLERLWWPRFIGYLEDVGAFAIDRTQPCLDAKTQEHLEAISQGNGILAIFPEGSRNLWQVDKSIVERKQVKSGVGAVAAKYGLDIVTVGIYGAAAEDRGNFHAHFGPVIPVERRDVDLGSVKSIVRATREITPQVYEGMNAALAIAIGERAARD